MKLQCRSCGEMFTVDPETVSLQEEGYIQMGDLEQLCDECTHWGYSATCEMETFDGDIGL